MLYWIIIFSSIALLAAGLGLETTKAIALGSAVILSCIFLLRWAVGLAQRTLQS